MLTDKSVAAAGQILGRKKSISHGQGFPCDQGGASQAHPCEMDFCVKEAEMPLVRTKKSSGSFFIMSKSPINDDKLSWKAKGLLAYLMSKPNDWQVWVNDIVKRSTDGRTAVLSALIELREHGYATREQAKREDGTFGPMEYVIYEEPQSGFPLAGEPITEEPQAENQTYTKNDYTNNDLTKNKETVSSSPEPTPLQKPVTEEKPDYIDLALHFSSKSKAPPREHIRDALAAALGVVVPNDHYMLKPWGRALDSLVGAFREMYGKKRIDAALGEIIIAAIGEAKKENGWDMCKGPSPAVMTRIVEAGRKVKGEERAGVDLAARQADEQRRVQELARAHGH